MSVVLWLTSLKMLGGNPIMVRSLYWTFSPQTSINELPSSSVLRTMWTIICASERNMPRKESLSIKLALKIDN